MGRIIVVGLDQSDREYVETASEYLSNYLLPGNSASATTTTSVSEVQRSGQSEVAFVRGNKTLGSSTSHPRNVPVSTVLGIREALSIAEISPSERTFQQEAYMKVWLGNMEDIKYLYLTEPDSILQTRPSSLKYIKHEIDNGGILAPHRLQPIPHQSDLFGGASTTANITFLKESDGFTNVLNLDAIENHDVCCDERAGKLFKPGPRDFPKCGRKTRWWACGLESQATNQAGDGDDPHIRLRPYQLIRLRQGTQLVTIAGTLHGRRCFASKNSFCP
jgi:hypothetical protein